MTLTKGDKAPAFQMRDAEGKTWDLEALKGKKVILYFYPADDTPGCTAQACDFRDSQSDLQSAGYVVLGVSPQGADSHRRFAGKYGLNFPLLIDDGLKTARAYGALKSVPKRVKRSTFVIDEDGRIEQALYGVRAAGHVAGLKETLGV